MKAYATASILLCAALAPASILHAQEQPAVPVAKEAESFLSRHVRVQVEFIELSLEQMTALMADPAATKTDTILRRRLDDLVKTGKAEIIETQMVVARSGQKASSESIREFIYPTEYEPPELPNEIHIHNKDGDAKIPNKEIATGPTPTAFETRNLGSTLEVEPTISEDGKLIDLRFAPEIVYHVENTTWATWKDGHGEANIMMPVIYCLRINTATTLAAGRPTLVGALSPKDDKGVPDFSRKLMVFVRCDVVTDER